MEYSEIFRRPYVYTRLRDNEIRIAHLQPDEGDNVIVVELSHELLGIGIAPYRALSWEWGEAGMAGVAQTIFVIDKKSTERENTKQGVVHAGRLTVRPNLLAALKRLRRGDGDVRLWIDAICIEQMGTGDDQNADEKNLEKSNQILLMAQIFGTAEDVCIWLGKDGEGDNSAQAIGFIKKLSNLQNMDVVAELKSGTCDVNDLIAFMKLLKRGWFGRRWIVQEVAMARSATLYCGKESISWPQFTAAVSLLEAVGRDGALNKILTRILEIDNPAEYIGNTSSMPAYRLIQKATGEPHGPEHGVGACRYTFEELVSWMGAFKASRLHDTIYAIVGLACDVTPGPPTTDRTQTPGINPKLIRRHTMGLEENIQPFEVDYNIAPLVVFKRFIKHATKKSGSLDIICRPWAPASGTDARDKAAKIELPSWIASLDRKPFQPNRHGNMVRCNPDPIVGPAGFGRRWYSASGLVKFDVPFHEIDNPNSKTMIVKGFTLDTIQDTWECGLFGNVPGDWLVAGGWEKETDLPPKELWRTLVAGRDAHGNDAERWYPLAFQSSVKERGIRYGFETRTLIHDNTNSKVVELFGRVQAVVWNRRLIRTRGEYLTWEKRDRKVPGCGSLGLAPDGARKGDLICIIFGCSVPLVLRPEESPRSDNSQTTINVQEDDASGGRSTPTSKIDPEEHYTLIGECYIDHMMDGEAIGYFKEAKEKGVREYRLV